MLSRLVSEDKASAVKPVVWRGAGGSAGSAGPGAPANVPEPTPGTSVPAQEDQQARVLMTQQARIQELERELDSRPREAYQRGFTEGQAAGLKQANARVDPVLAKLAQSIQDLVAV